MTNLQDLITELHTLDRELARYEEKYGLLSETFFSWYQSGEEPDDPAWVLDFALWAGAYQLKLRRQEKYRRLVSDSLARHAAPVLIRQELPVGTPA